MSNVAVVSPDNLTIGWSSGTSRSIWAVVLSTICLCAAAGCDISMGVWPILWWPAVIVYVYDAVWFYRRYFNIRPRCGGTSVCTKSAPQSNVQYRLNANILWPFFHPNIWNIPKILDPGKFNALTQSVTLNYSFTWPPASQTPGAHRKPSAKIGNQQIFSLFDYKIKNFVLSCIFHNSWAEASISRVSSVSCDLLF